MYILRENIFLCKLLLLSTFIILFLNKYFYIHIYYWNMIAYYECTSILVFELDVLLVKNTFLFCLNVVMSSISGFHSILIS